MKRAQALLSGHHKHDRPIHPAPKSTSTFLKKLRAVSAPPGTIGPIGPNTRNDADYLSDDGDTGVIPSIETDIAPTTVDSNGPNHYPVISYEDNGHDSSTGTPEPSDVTVQGELTSASAGTLHYLTEAFTPFEGSSHATTPAIANEDSSTDDSNEGIGSSDISDDYMSSSDYSDDESDTRTIRGVPRSTNLPDLRGQELNLGRQSLEAAVESSVDDFPRQRPTSRYIVPDGSASLPLTNNRFTTQEERASLHTIGSSSTSMPFTTNRFTAQEEPSSLRTRTVASSFTGVPLSTQNSFLHGPIAQTTVPGSYNGGGARALIGDIPVEARAQAQDHGVRPRRRRTTLLDDGKLRCK